MVERKGRNGGTLRSMEKGDPTLPGAGRPKKLPEIDALINEVMGSEGGEIDKSGALEIFSGLMKQAKKGNTHAAEILLNRAFGKVPNKNEHTGKDGGPIETKTIIIELPPDDGSDE